MRAVHDGYVTVFALGGGFEQRIPQAAWRDGRFRAVTQADLEAVSLRPASFTLDGASIYPGWHNNHRWNGFAMPCFTQDVFVAICRDIGLGVRIIDDTAVELAASSDAKEEPSLVAFVPAPDAGGLRLATFDGWCWMISTDE